MLFKKQGTIYETLFTFEALKRNLDVFNPVGDYSTIDSVVLNPAGKCYRVQVKGTNCTLDKNRFNITAGVGPSKSLISATDVDILACYIQPRDVWYLLPMVKAAGRKRFALYPIENSKSRWEPYRNNWDIFF